MKIFRLDYSQYDTVFHLMTDEHEVITGQMC